MNMPCALNTSKSCRVSNWNWKLWTMDVLSLLFAGSTEELEDAGVSTAAEDSGSGSVAFSPATKVM